MALPPEAAVVFCRIDNAHIYTPYEGDLNKGNPKFTAKCIIDPKDERGKKSLEKAQAAAKHVAQANGLNWPVKFADPKRYCISDGNQRIDEKKGEVRKGYADMTVISASRPAKNKQGVIDPPFIKAKDGETNLTAESGIPYNGSYCKVLLKFYYTTNGGKGLFAILEGVQFIDHGDPLGGARIEASQAFQDESEDEM